MLKNGEQLSLGFKYYTKEKEDMCKIAIIPGIKKETTNAAWRLMKELSEEMTMSDNDGFGYAALDGEGKMFGERWFYPKDAFKYTEKSVAPEITLEKQYEGFIKVPKADERKAGNYNNFGVVHENSLSCAILHARNATCARTMENLHPFVIGETALIHNGVIGNTEEIGYKNSTCDSECILVEYIKNDVANDLKNIQKMADKLRGSYACGVISKMSDGTPIVDVFRDTSSKLRGYFIKELGQIVFGTAYQEGWGPIPSACKDLRFTIVREYEIPDHKAVRINAMTGEVMQWLDYDSTYKGKSGRDGGSNRSLTLLGNEVANRHRNVFPNAGHTHSDRHKNWSDKQKEEEMERMLCEGDFSYLGYTTYIPEDKLPVVPNKDVLSISSARVEVWEEDFEPDESGMWHKKAVSSK